MTVLCLNYNPIFFKLLIDCDSLAIFCLSLLGGGGSGQMDDLYRLLAGMGLEPGILIAKAVEEGDVDRVQAVVAAHPDHVSQWWKRCEMMGWTSPSDGGGRDVKWMGRASHDVGGGRDVKWTSRTSYVDDGGRDVKWTGRTSYVDDGGRDVKWTGRTSYVDGGGRDVEWSSRAYIDDGGGASSGVCCNIVQKWNHACTVKISEHLLVKK